MMLDNKSEQKCPLTAADYETGSQGSFLFYHRMEAGKGPFFSFFGSVIKAEKSAG